MKSSPLLRKTPMPRTSIVAAPVRRVPLRARVTRIRPVSRKRAVDQREYLAGKAEYLTENPVCGADCDQPATDLHHLTNRSQSARAFLDPTNWMGLCREHHSWVTQNPHDAAALGLAKPGWLYRQERSS